LIETPATIEIIERDRPYLVFGNRLYLQKNVFAALFRQSVILKQLLDFNDVIHFAN
jgi:hypothetical protein